MNKTRQAGPQSICRMRLNEMPNVVRRRGNARVNTNVRCANERNDMRDANSIDDVLEVTELQILDRTGTNIGRR